MLFSPFSVEVGGGPDGGRGGMVVRLLRVGVSGW